MSNVNVVVLCGRLGADPEMKFFDSGAAKTTFNIAVSEYDKQSQSEKTLWFPVETWKHNAEYIGEYAKKGSIVTVSGNLSINEWTGEDGSKHKKVFVRASNVQLHDKKPD